MVVVLTFNNGYQQIKEDVKKVENGSHETKLYYSNEIETYLNYKLRMVKVMENI